MESLYTIYFPICSGYRTGRANKMAEGSAVKTEALVIRLTPVIIWENGSTAADFEQSIKISVQPSC